MIEPKVQDRPKIVLDLEEPEIKFWAQKIIFWLDLDWAKKAKIVKSYKQAQKEFWAPGDLKKRRIGPEIRRRTSLGLL